MFCRSLFVLWYFFFLPLCCLFFFDIRIFITPLVSSNSSYERFPLTEESLPGISYQLRHIIHMQVMLESTIYFNNEKQFCRKTLVWRVWRYQRGNENPYIEEEQTTQWQKEKVPKDKQRSTKHTYKTKDRVTRIPLKPEG
jgi:hypothetical protein